MIQIGYNERKEWDKRKINSKVASRNDVGYESSKNTDTVMTKTIKTWIYK